MSKEAQLQSQVANLEAQNARIIKEKEEIQKAYEKYNAYWLASERDNEELRAELAKHEWVAVEKAKTGITYQCCDKNGGAYCLGSKCPSGQWMSTFGYMMSCPDLIKPITLPKPACPCPHPQCSDDRRCGDKKEVDNE